MLWAPKKRPMASRCRVTLPEGSALQAMRRLAAAVDRGAERGPRRPAFRPQTTRQGAHAATGDGLGRGRGRGFVPSQLLIAVGEDRYDPRRGRRRGGRGRREGTLLRRQATISTAGKKASGPNARRGLSAMTARDVVARVAIQGTVARVVFVGEVKALAVAVFAGGGRGAMAVRENVACDAVVRKANARAVATQEMLPLAAALREVFLVSVAAQEKITRAEAVQEVPARAVLLQEVVGLTVAVREVLARSVAEWWLDGAPVGRGDAGGVRAPTKEHEYTHATKARVPHFFHGSVVQPLASFVRQG